MGTKSKIEWTETTWNPLAGCTPVSPGCAHCYAARQSRRLAAMGLEKYAGVVDAHGRWTGKINLDYAALRQPLQWKAPRRVFVNSMSDLFHEDVPFDFIDQVFDVMALCPQHTFQVLTKRPERMVDYLAEYAVRVGSKIKRLTNVGPLSAQICAIDLWHQIQFGGLRNVWLGTSVENQAEADRRIPALLLCPARVRFLSCEPLLEPVTLDLTGIQWVIAGGESGPPARPMHPDWVRGVRDQCQQAGVPFFFKQWGEWAPSADLFARGVAPGESRQPWGQCQPRMDRVGKRAAGRELDGRTWEEMPGEEV